MAVQLHYSRPLSVEGVRVARGPVDAVYARMLAAAVVIGVVFVFSASFPLADRTLAGGHAFHFLYRQLVHAALGLLCLCVATRFAPRTLAGLSRWLVVPSILLMLACRWSPWAHEVNGSYLWLRFGSLTVQPSEFVKLVYVLLLAWFMARPVDEKWTIRSVWGFSLLAMLVMCGLLTVQRDLGMSFLVVGVALGMLFMRGLSAWLICGLAGVLAFGGGLATYLFFPGRWQRIIVFLDPHSDPAGSGYHLCQMLAALARGGLAGSSLGMSPDKWGALPTPHTDSIFCVIGAELGIFGALFVLLLILVMAGRAFRIAERAGTPTAWYVGCGMAFMLALQSLINIAVATVSMPCTGLTLPFISYGGSSLVSSMIAAGIVLAVSRYVSLEKE